MNRFTPPAIEGIEQRHARWCRLSVATLRFADGQMTHRDIEDHGDAVAVLPYDPAARRALLVRQFRAPPAVVSDDGMMLELPAGRLDGAAPDDQARREVMEELGLHVRELVRITTVWTMPALSTERAHLYFAQYSTADRIAEGGGLADEHEHIEIVEMPLTQLADMADAGTLTELKLLLLVQTLRLQQAELFGPA